MTPLRKQSGFTLLEVVIVAALLVLLSGLLVVNLAEMRHRSTVAAGESEAQSMATAVGFAYNAVGIFPNLGYLALPKVLLSRPGQPDEVRQFFDYMGFYNDAAGRKAPSSILRNWSSTGFYGWAQGRDKALIKVQLPDRSIPPIDWPSDPWGNPYVLYLVKYIEGGSPTPYRFIDTAKENPDFMAALVSYGPDMIPGSVTGIPDRFPGNQFPALKTARLYQDARDVDPGSSAQFFMLPFTEYNGEPLRRKIIGPDSGTTFRNDFIPGAGAGVNLLGLLHPRSDDIIVTF